MVLKKICQNLLVSVVLFFTVTVPTFAREPITPIPQVIEYDKTKALLGKRLFSDPLLSSDGKVSCETCHDLTKGGAEPRETSIGVFERKGAMNAPTVFNAYFNFRQFWNGRASDLKEQAAGPLHSPIEMDMNTEDVEQALNSHPEYPTLFQAVYKTLPISFEQVVDAIAEFEKALFTPDSKFDLYLRGKSDLTVDERDGYILFKSLGCVSCHNGINIGGNSFQYLGAVNPIGRDMEGDLYSLTGDPFDRNRFKVPTLRNIALTSPYLHDGSMKTLSDVLHLMSHHNLGFKLSDRENQLLTAFLNTLTGKMPEILKTP